MERGVLHHHPIWKFVMSYYDDDDANCEMCVGVSARNLKW